MINVDIYGKSFEVLGLDEVDDYDNPVANVCLSAKFSDGDWFWFIVAGEPLGSNGDYRFFGLVNGFEKELGFFTLSELGSVNADIVDDFEPCGIYDIYPDFDLRK